MGPPGRLERRLLLDVLKKDGGWMMRTITPRVGCLLLLFWPVLAYGSAQSSFVSSFNRVRLNPGDRIWIALASGRSIQGTAIAVSDRFLTVQTKGDRRTLREDEVYQIYRIRQGTSRGQGALKGAVIGAGVALAAELLLQQESDAGPLVFFSIVGIASIPSGAAIGALLSGDKGDLIYQNPRLTRPLLLKKLHLSFSAGANVLEGFDDARAVESGLPPSLVFKGIYRATPRWGLGADLLLTRTRMRSWASRFSAGEERREITAPGFNIYYFPLVGNHELYTFGGFSVFHQKATVQRLDSFGGLSSPHHFTETKLDYFLQGGLGYQYHVGGALGLGSELQLYRGSNWPAPLVRLSASISLRY